MSIYPLYSIHQKKLHVKIVEIEKRKNNGVFCVNAVKINLDIGVFHVNV